MKKIIAALFAFAMLSPAVLAFATAEETALATAQAIVGADAVLTETESDDDYFEFEFNDAAANIHYDVLVEAQSGVACRLDTEYKRVPGAAAALLDEAAARAIVAEAVPTALLQFALLEKDGKHFEWKVFYTDAANLGIYSIQAETGDVRDTEIYYSLPEGTLMPDKLLEAITAAKGECALLKLDFDINDDSHTYCYDGKAELGGVVYEFEIGAADGLVTEWEVDD